MIIGIKDGGNVWLAYTWSDGIRTNVSGATNGENIGVWKVNGNPHTVMGCRIPSAETEAFRYEDALFQGRLDFDKLVEETVPRMEQFAEGRGYIGDSRGRFDELMIAQKDRLYVISSEHVVLDVDSFYAIGCGDDQVKGVLLATEGEPALERIRKAFAFLGRLEMSVASPIFVMDTKSEKLQILTQQD